MKILRTKKLFLILATFIPTLLLISCAYSPIVSLEKVNNINTTTQPVHKANVSSQNIINSTTKNNSTTSNTKRSEGKVSDNSTKDSKSNNSQTTTEQNNSKSSKNPSNTKQNEANKTSYFTLQVDLHKLQKQRDEDVKLIKFSIYNSLSYNIKQLSASIPLESFTNKVHLFNIPAIKKFQNEALILDSDAREYNTKDSFNIAKQVSKFSTDEGKTWSDLQSIVKVGGGKHNAGLAVDGYFISVEDSENPSKNKLIFAFDITQPDFSLFNWYKKPHNEIVNSNLRNWRRFYIF